MRIPKDPHKFILSLGFAIVTAIDLYNYIKFLLK